MIILIVFATFLVLIGLFNLFAPRTAWFAFIGWKIRDAEPSDIYLIIQRIGGVFACIIAIVIFIGAGTGQTRVNTQTSEKAMRDILATSQIESVTMQMQPVISINTDQLKSWIIDSNWETPTVDYGQSHSFSAKGELDLHFDNGSKMSVFDMGNGQFGISKNLLYPDFIFSSPLLKSWLSEHKY